MSFEENLKNKIKSGDELPEKLEISVLRYFWQSNHLVNKKEDSIPRFLRKIDALENFSDNELRILSKYLHFRKFANGEVIFKQGEQGVGFYLIYSGFTDIIVKGNQAELGIEEEDTKNVLTLERFDNFGELALLQENSIRNATAVSRQGTELLGIFKPDIEEMINTYPLIAAKLLQSVSYIVATRFFALTREVQQLKYKVMSLEKREKNA